MWHRLIACIALGVLFCGCEEEWIRSQELTERNNRGKGSWAARRNERLDLPLVISLDGRPKKQGGVVKITGKFYLEGGNGAGLVFTAVGEEDQDEFEIEIEGEMRPRVLELMRNDDSVAARWKGHDYWFYYAPKE